MRKKILTSGLPAVISACFLLAACGGGGSNVDPLEEIAAIADDGTAETRSDQEADEQAAPTVLSDQVTFDAFAVFPGIVELQESATTGLLVGFTAEDQSDIDISVIDEAWLSMQDCLGVRSDPPLLVIQEDSVEPLDSTDDVILDFAGRIAASGNDSGSGASLQIRFAELVEPGFGGQVSGFTLRSIMGRYLWRDNNRLERDYDTSCASRPG